ncbi:MAG: hypothetical protein L3J89_09605 [Gammaproteobacteria bacterium]|nr:hypothetical protein [Gammaproteobacteria bacterium]
MKENVKHLDVKWDEWYQFRHMLKDKIFHLSIFKSLAVPMIKMTYIPLILLALIWLSPAHASCDYEDLPSLVDTIEIVPFPGPPDFFSMTEKDKKELKARQKEAVENSNHRTIVRRSFIIWMHVDCARQLDPLYDKKAALDGLKLFPPFESNKVEAIYGKVVDMTFEGSASMQVQKMAQKAFWDLLDRENRGERIRWH